MENLNIRAYKTVSSGGKFLFEKKSNDSRGAIGCSSIENLALLVNKSVKTFLRKNKNEEGEVTIDLKPYHDIECTYGLSPIRCLPLNEAEVEEFWAFFETLGI